MFLSSLRFVTHHNRAASPPGIRGELLAEGKGQQQLCSVLAGAFCSGGAPRMMGCTCRLRRAGARRWIAHSRRGGGRRHVPRPGWGRCWDLGGGLWASITPRCPGHEEGPATPSVQLMKAGVNSLQCSHTPSAWQQGTQGAGHPSPRAPAVQSGSSISLNLAVRL